MCALPVHITKSVTGHAKYLSHIQIEIIEKKRFNSRKRHTIHFCMESTADSEMEEMLQQQECSPEGGGSGKTIPLAKSMEGLGPAHHQFECKEIPQHFSMFLLCSRFTNLLQNLLHCKLSFLPDTYGV